MEMIWWRSMGKQNNFCKTAQIPKWGFQVAFKRGWAEQDTLHLGMHLLEGGASNTDTAEKLGLPLWDISPLTQGPTSVVMLLKSNSICLWHLFICLLGSSWAVCDLPSLAWLCSGASTGARRAHCVGWNDELCFCRVIYWLQNGWKPSSKGLKNLPVQSCTWDVSPVTPLGWGR